MYPIPSCNQEIKYVVANLFEHLDEEERYFIWRVNVYDHNVDIHCQSEDILVYNEEVGRTLLMEIKNAIFFKIK